MSTGSSVPRFSVLSKLRKTLCVLPNSNAGCERVFSKVRHIKMDFRKRTCNDTHRQDMCLVCNDTMQALLVREKSMVGGD